VDPVPDEFAPTLWTRSPEVAPTLCGPVPEEVALRPSRRAGVAVRPFCLGGNATRRGHAV